VNVRALKQSGAPSKVLGTRCGEHHDRTFFIPPGMIVPDREGRLKSSSGLPQRDRELVPDDRVRLAGRCGKAAIFDSLDSNLRGGMPCRSRARGSVGQRPDAVCEEADADPARLHRFAGSSRWPKRSRSARLVNPGKAANRAGHGGWGL